MFARRHARLAGLAALLCSPLALGQSAPTPDDGPDAEGKAGEESSAEEKEAAIYESQPDILDCNSFSWMENCEQRNEYYKRHPRAHMRLENQQGHEFNFPPGTPSAMISLMMNPSPATARAYVKYLERDEQIRKKVASSVRQAQVQSGLMGQGQREFEQYMKTRGPNYSVKGGQAFLFVKEDCDTCDAMLPAFLSAGDRLPNIAFSVLVAGSQERANEINAVYAGNARYMNDSELAQYENQIDSFPALWIEGRNGQRLVESGYKDSEQIMDAARGLTEGRTQ